MRNSYEISCTMSMVMMMGLALGVSAEELPKESVLPLGAANKAVQAAIESCRKDGYRVSVSVVDRAGILRAMGRADGAGPHTVDSSRKKAYTAASVRRPTTELAELITKVQTLQALREMNDNIREARVQVANMIAQEKIFEGDMQDAQRDAHFRAIRETIIV